jgi:hypothetical protein
MGAALFVLSLLWQGAPPGWRVVWSGPMKASYMYAPPLFAANGAFVFSGPSNSGAANYRFDPRARVLRAFAQGEEWGPQIDCGSSLISLKAGKQLKTYDIATGDLLSSVPLMNDWIRTGGVITILDRRVNPPLSQFYDARSGQRLPGNPPAYLIWDSPKVRLSISLNRLYRFSPGTFKVISETGIAPFSQDFDRFVGNPEKPPFVIVKSFIGVGVESFSYTVIDEKYMGHRYPQPHIWHASKYGVLASSDIGYPTPRGKNRYPDIVCLELKSGKVRWKSLMPLGEYAVAGWEGPNVKVIDRAGYVILNGKNGRVIRHVNAPQPIDLRRSPNGQFALIVKGKTITLLRKR